MLLWLFQLSLDDVFCILIWAILWISYWKYRISYGFNLNVLAIEACRCCSTVSELFPLRVF